MPCGCEGEAKCAGGHFFEAGRALLLRLFFKVVATASIAVWFEGRIRRRVGCTMRADVQRLVDRWRWRGCIRCNVALFSASRNQRVFLCAYKAFQRRLPRIARRWRAFKVSDRQSKDLAANVRQSTMLVVQN